MAKEPAGRFVRLCACALVLSVWTLRALAGEFHIHYAEPVAIRSATAAADATQQKSAKVSIAFEAYGRQFALELEANDRLLNALPPERRAAMSEYQLYRGRLTGIDGSWVRLTRHREEWQGVVWDGRDLYTMAPARSVAPFLVQPLKVADATPLVYRLADVDVGLGADFCATAANDAPHTGLTAYRALVGELQAQTAALDGQIELAVLGDREFLDRFATNALGELLARTNVIDGIFSDQVGVLIVVPDFRLFTNDNPFTTSRPIDLLAELATYRENTPEIRERGLAHLFTGRQLEENTAGIAYLGAVCDPRFGVGLTEGWLDVTASSLIAAHELGHNFGAVHDGDPVEACASTPQTFLMAPAITGTNRFSQCSLERMRARLQTATCITPVDVADVALRGDASVDVVLGDSYEYLLEVDSRGSQPADDVMLRIQGPPGLGIESVRGESATCFVADSDHICELGAIAGHTNQRVVVRMRPRALGRAIVTATLSAANDRVPSNNQLYATIAVAEPPDPDIGDAALDAESSFGARQNQSFDYVVSARVASTRAVTDVTVDIPLPVSIRVESMRATDGRCTASAGNVHCELGTIASNSRREIRLRLRANASGTFATTPTLTAVDDGNAQNNSRTVSLVIAPPAVSAANDNRRGGGAADFWLLAVLLLATGAILRAAPSRN